MIKIVAWDKTPDGMFTLHLKYNGIGVRVSRQERGVWRVTWDSGTPMNLAIELDILEFSVRMVESIRLGEYKGRGNSE